MASWYPTIKTIKGHHYIYRQRTWRENGRVRSETQYIGPIDAAGAMAIREERRVRARKRSKTAEIGMAVFGIEDEYGRPVDSLWNRYINGQAPKATSEPAQAHPETGRSVATPSDPDTAAGAKSGESSTPTPEDSSDDGRV